jgi:hypothetical protein
MTYLSISFSLFLCRVSRQLPASPFVSADLEMDRSKDRSETGDIPGERSQRSRPRRREPRLFIFRLPFARLASLVSRSVLEIVIHFNTRLIPSSPPSPPIHLLPNRSASTRLDTTSRIDIKSCRRIFPAFLVHLLISFPDARGTFSAIFSRCGDRRAEPSR